MVVKRNVTIWIENPANDGQSFEESLQKFMYQSLNIYAQGMNISLKLVFDIRIIKINFEV